MNCMLNYGYSLLEAECLRTINSVGLDTHEGIRHEMATERFSTFTGSSHGWIWGSLERVEKGFTSTDTSSG